MEFLTVKYEAAQDALNTLEEAIKDLKSLDQEYEQGSALWERRQHTFKDSMIQRFEYSFDITWKYIRHYLEQIVGVEFEVKGSRSIFRMCFKVGLFSQMQTELALQMVDDRNLTTHAYDQETADQICDKIPEYYGFLKTALEKMPPKK